MKDVVEAQKKLTLEGYMEIGRATLRKIGLIITLETTEVMFLATCIIPRITRPISRMEMMGLVVIVSSSKGCKRVVDIRAVAPFRTLPTLASRLQRTVRATPTISVAI